MHRLSIGVLMAACCVLALAPVAHASLASNAQELEALVSSSVSSGTVAGSAMPGTQLAPPMEAPLPATTTDPTGVGDATKGATSPGGNEGQRQTLKQKKPKTRIRCVIHAGGKTTCTYTRSGHAYKRCQFANRRLKNGRCTFLKHKSAKSGAAAALRARSAASISWQGFPNPAISQVGKIWIFRGNSLVSACSGTLVSKTLVLTAGHCVYDISTHRYYDRLYFVPGGTYNAAAGYVKQNEPYGVWKGYAWWTTGNYQSTGDSSLDWGLIELQPEDGVYAGQKAGTFQAFYDIPWPVGTRVYSVGYSASGIWRQANYYEGRQQYACDSSYTGWQQIVGGYGLTIDCTMNGGASGGPWFRYYNGKWVVVGVNNLCTPKTYDTCAPYSSQLISSWFDKRFASFWSGVVPGRLHF
jgi:V8-like Glu-specific endopeptidase